MDPTVHSCHVNGSNSPLLSCQWIQQPTPVTSVDPTAHSSCQWIQQPTHHVSGSNSPLLSCQWIQQPTHHVSGSNSPLLSCQWIQQPTHHVSGSNSPLLSRLQQCLINKHHHCIYVECVYLYYNSRQINTIVFLLSNILPSWHTYTQQKHLFEYVGINEM